jgi:phage anti-repressor protein
MHQHQHETSIIAVVDSSIDGGSTVQTVNARELHAFLEVGKRFSDWIKDRVEKYGFVENQDFTIISQNGEKSEAGRPAIDYHISLDMAKELAMVERNEKGRVARKYFIECEKELRRREEERRQNRSELEKARDELALQKRLVDALEREEALRIEQARNFQVPRPVVDEAAEGIALQRIKSTIAPYLSIKTIAAVLKYFGQRRAIVQYGQHENQVVKPFARDGIEVAIRQFIEEADKRVSFSRKSVVLKHDCLLGDEAQIGRDDAIAYLGYRAEQFED